VHRRLGHRLAIALWIVDRLHGGGDRIHGAPFVCLTSEQHPILAGWSGTDKAVEGWASALCGAMVRFWPPLPEGEGIGSEASPSASVQPLDADGRCAFGVNPL
jgi:hypothetical protein